MPNPQIKVRLSILERRQIAILLPEFAKRLELDEPNSRMIPFSLDEAKRVLDALKSDTRKHRAMVQSALERAMESFENAIEDATGIGTINANKRLYQFRITLNESEPSIWRRIQSKNCSLERFHEHIQLAMGWGNEHLHRFRIKDEIYGDAQLLDDGFDDQNEFIDSTGIKIGDVVPKSGKRISFEYEYDFGDGWKHEVLFEGCLAATEGQKYPICVEGERACPPEDVGGIFGYNEYLKIIGDPNHEQHEEMLEWRGKFDPEKFDSKKASKKMQRGMAKGKDAD
ncbi:MAG: plasmid pRiA4b ORF-3 family protein [Pirellula staleyi]